MSLFGNNRVRRHFVWSLCLFSVCRISVHAQPPSECQTDIAELLQYKIREVNVQARYLPQIVLPNPGEQYTPEKESEVLRRVQEAFAAERTRETVEGETEFQVLGAVTVGKGEGVEIPATANQPSIRVGLYTTCKKVVNEADCKAILGDTSGKCIDLVVQVKSFRFDPKNISQNLLPVPRSGAPTFMSNVPEGLRAFNPRFGVDHDRGFGLAERLEVSANLLDLSDNLRGKPLEVKAARLDLEAHGRKSLSEPFYTTDTELSLSHSRQGSIAKLALMTGFSADHEPRGNGNFLKNAATIGGGMKLRLPAGPFKLFSLGAGYKWSTNRFIGDHSSASDSTSDTVAEARVLADGTLWTGFLRAALWADSGKPENTSRRYHRFAGMIGYEKELPVALNQTVGVELIVGAGRARGGVPEYARFYGGNMAKSFIYEPADSAVLTAFPVGPLMRGMGSGQAAERTSGGLLVGGTSYAHLNLNVSIPIPRWSYPLIPDIDISLAQVDENGDAVLDEDGNEVEIDRPLKSVIKLQAENSRRILTRLYTREGLPADEAAAKVDAELGDIRTIVGFLADQANIFSIKPLVMFDVARVDSPLVSDSTTKIAVGGGVQLTVVVAKFEAGYMRSVRRVSGDDNGTFLVRMVFQNLF